MAANQTQEARLKPLTTKVSADEREWLERQAELEDRTVSAIVRRLIRERMQEANG
jgi:uncharacterized protein (DUF1778 family)